MDLVMGYLYPSKQGYFSPLTPATANGDKYPMSQLTFIEALQSALKQTGSSVRSIAAKSGVPYERLKQVARGRTNSTNADDAYRIAQAFGVSFESFMEGDIKGHPPSVEVAGSVGAGAKVPVFEVYEKGAGPRVEVPAGFPSSGIVAVEVQGDSMAPTYSPGEMLFYTRATPDGVPDDAIGRICVIEDIDGMGWVKQLRTGDEPGLFHLVSINSGSETMWNKRVKWAARVRFNLSPELVRKVGG
ncbi:S24 family peptidase [Roseivivax sp. THAF197b]|uniref:S24 family peptidase n=1 Tax=Roseivivax sp. THAF197b TaxID=2588299 RepID=UPI0020C7550A|nr:S24 family peptidase [Roseivivax sp. THAF197b]